jgi:hypothetical protein
MRTYSGKFDKCVAHGLVMDINILKWGTLYLLEIELKGRNEGNILPATKNSCILHDSEAGAPSLF